MQQLKVLVADDDAGMRLVLRKILDRTDGFTLCGEASNGREALELFERERPQVVFLDVEMPDPDGAECARQIADMDPRAYILFATAHESYRKEAFEVYAFDYLVKPFKVERVKETLSRILGYAVQRSKAAVRVADMAPRGSIRKLMVHHKEGISLIDADEIVLIQREDRNTAVYTASGGKAVTGETLSELQERLDKDVFVRCHKSYIVNLNMICEVYPYGRWTYIAKLKNTTLDALITHDKFEEIEKMLSGTC